MATDRRRRRDDGPSGPVQLGDLLAEASRELAPPTLLAAVQSAWDDAAGPVAAGQAEPVSERDGIVTISCRSAVWAQELEMLQDVLLAKLRQSVAPLSIAGLRFTALPPARR